MVRVGAYLDELPRQFLLPAVLNDVHMNVPLLLFRFVVYANIDDFIELSNFFQFVTRDAWLILGQGLARRPAFGAVRH